MQEMEKTEIQSLGQEDPLEKELPTYSSILAWEFPWTERSLVGHSPRVTQGVRPDWAHIQHKSRSNDDDLMSKAIILWNLVWKSKSVNFKSFSWVTKCSFSLIFFFHLKILRPCKNRQWVLELNDPLLESFSPYSWVQVTWDQRQGKQSLWRWFS